MTIDKRTRILSTLVIILTFVMVLLPAQIAVGWIQRIIVGITGGLSVFFQLLLLISVESKTKKTQSYVLLALSLLAITLMLILY
jgi:hypothetical protein